MPDNPPRLATLDSIQAFEPCSVYGEKFTPDHLRAMALNWAAFRDRMEPPLVLGHEEKQKLLNQLQDTSIPAHGWINDIRFDPAAPDRNGVLRPALIFGAQEVQEDTANAINNRQYKKVSPEVWNRPPEQMFDDRDHILRELKSRNIDADEALAEASEWAPQELARLTAKMDAGKINKVPKLDWLIDFHMRDRLGPMTRRLALLGGEPPRNGKLADLGHARFSDHRRADEYHNDQEYEVFMAIADEAVDDAPSADDERRARYESTLAKLELPPDAIAVLTSLSTPKLEMLAHALLEDEAGVANPPVDEDTVAAEEDAETPEEEQAEDEGDPSIESMIADLVAMGASEDELQSLTPEDLQSLWEDKKGATMSAPAVTTPPSRRVATPVSDEQFSAALEEIREIKATFGVYADQMRAREEAIKRDLRASQAAAKAREKVAEAERKRAVEQILADAQKGAAPKILPAEEARYRRRLMDADMATVQKFGDRECTAFEDIVNEINERPVVRVFGAEKTKIGGADAGVDAEVAAYVARNKRRA